MKLEVIYIHYLSYTFCRMLTVFSEMMTYCISVSMKTANIRRNMKERLYIQKTCNLIYFKHIC